jgi:D-3-phosphoglycerate dehydrogenase
LLAALLHRPPRNVLRRQRLLVRPDTTERPVIDARALASVRRGAYLINTARAALVDHTAVEEALETGLLSGFATDVYDTEPGLLRRGNVIATPHIGGLTEESIDRATHAAVDNLLRVLDPCQPAVGRSG